MSIIGLAGFVGIVAVFITAWWGMVRFMFDTMDMDMGAELRHDPVFFISMVAMAAVMAVAATGLVVLVACGVWLLFVHMVFPASVR